MVADGSGAMDPEAERQNKLDEYMSMLQRRLSDTEASRYTARVRKYANLQEKRRRAAASRKHVEHVQKDQAKKKVEGDQPKATDGCDRQADHGEHSRRRGAACEHGRGGSLSRSRSGEPVDSCGCRRKRRRRSRRRRRSCRRRRSRRRRRRSCRRRRRSCRRRRSRRRRRRSCRRRRRRTRRCCR